MLRESTSPSGPARMSEGITPEVSLLHDLHTELGEAPTWDERTQRLYFVDINGKKIYSSGEDGSDLFHIDTPETVGTIALTTDDNILLAAMNRSPPSSKCSTVSAMSVGLGSLPLTGVWKGISCVCEPAFLISLRSCLSYKDCTVAISCEASCNCLSRQPGKAVRAG